MYYDLRIFLIIGMFFIIFLGFITQMARTEERIEHPPSSWMNVFNLLIILTFVIIYIFLAIVVLGWAVK